MRPKKILLVCVCLLSGVAASCSGAAYMARMAGDRSKTAADREFDRLAGDFVAEFLALNPTAASINGSRDHDGKWEDLSEGGVRASLAVYARHRALIAAIDAGSIGAQNRVDRERILNAIDILVFNLARLKRHEWDPSLYSEIVKDGLTGLPASAVTGYRSRLERLPAFLLGARKTLSNASPAHLQHAARQIDAVAGTVSDAAAKRSLMEFSAWLTGTLLPGSTRDPRIGTGLWEEMFAVVLDTGLNPLDLVAAAKEQAAATRARVIGLASEDRVRTATAALSVDTLKQEAARIREFIGSRALVTLPPREISPAFLLCSDGCDTLSPAVFIPSSAGLTPSLIFNTGYLRSSGRETIGTLLIHELYPGHFTQWWHAMSSSSVTYIRRLFPNLAFIEGWAVYVEEMMYDAGWGSGDRDAELRRELERLKSPLNLIVDHGLHTRNMSGAQAVELLVTAGFQRPDEAAARVERAILSPVQMSSYFAGHAALESAIKKLKARNPAGLKQSSLFDSILSSGAIPLHLVESATDGR
ncbi:MAG: DUF885 family protein [Myxococcota bacterium]|jgi:uncharacterized protein (DUF885 family)